MNDAEITRLCADAIGQSVIAVEIGGEDHPVYDPLNDDAQAMALVKRFQIQSAPLIDGTTHEGWVAEAHVPFNRWTPKCHTDANLNRAICLCVAHMQKSIRDAGAGEKT